jgi:hypothetical protein
MGSAPTDTNVEICSAGRVHNCLSCLGSSVGIALVTGLLMENIAGKAKVKQQ